jgi:hypothetical protein
MRPATVSLGRDGTIGIILPDDPLFLTGARYLTVRHHNGQFENIPAPAPQLLAHSFRRFEAIGGSPKFQDVYFRTVEIASDGTAFATIASHFWGGYSGVETSTFRWRSQRWGVTTSLDVMPPQIPGWQVNTQIGGVDGDLSIALNGVYGDKVLPDNAYIDDPTYQLNRSRPRRRYSDCSSRKRRSRLQGWLERVSSELRKELAHDGHRMGSRRCS